MKYQSAKMVARRQRILETALELLSENDGTFTMRDLATRSDVALGTLYNLFGNQEALVADAVADVFKRRVAGMAIEATGDDLTAALAAWHEAASKEVMRVPVFAKTMARLYFNGEPGNRVRRMLHAVPTGYVRPLLEQVKADGGLYDWVDPARLAGEMTRVSYAVVSHWAAEEISDDRFLEEALYANYLLLAGAVKGRAHTQVIEAIKALEGNLPRAAKGKTA